MIDSLNTFMRYLELFEADYDPLKTQHSVSSFLYKDGQFIAVPYQSHLDVLGRVFDVAVPPWNDDSDARMEAFDQLTCMAVQSGVVQGLFQPGIGDQKTYLDLRGSLKACRQAFAAFRATYPNLMARVDAVSYDLLDPDGKRIESDIIEGKNIDRKFGRRY
jgi:hypothetical protein